MEGMHASIAGVPTGIAVLSNRTYIGNATAEITCSIEKVCVYDRGTLFEINRVNMRMTFVLSPLWKARPLLNSEIKFHKLSNRMHTKVYNILPPF
jgi:hypothetical protein